MLTIVSAGLYAYVIINHYLMYKDQFTYYQGICGYCFPCFFFFSRFQPDVKWEFALINGIFISLGLIICIYLYIKFDQKAKY